MNTTDIDAPYEDAGSVMSSAASRATARRLRRTRQKLGSYRHDLLVAMRIVNSIEKEMLQSEWENWLSNENTRCEQAALMLADSKDKTSATAAGEQQSSKRGRDQKVPRPVDEKRLDSLKTWHRDYCGSCRADQAMLDLAAAQRSLMG